MIENNIKKIESNIPRKMSILKKFLIRFGAILFDGLWFVIPLISEPDMANIPEHYPLDSVETGEQYLVYHERGRRTIGKGGYGGK